MYLTGQIYNFEQRLHQLPTGINDLNSYCIEASGYNATTDLLTRWDKEFFKKSWIFGFTGNYCDLQ